MTTERIEKFKESLEITIIVISFICFCAWVFFLSCFVLALGSDGNPGSIVEAGIYMLKNYPIISGLSLVPAGFFVWFLSKL